MTEKTIENKDTEQDKWMTTSLILDIVVACATLANLYFVLNSSEVEIYLIISLVTGVLYFIMGKIFQSLP